MNNATNATRPKPNNYIHIKYYKHKVKNQNFVKTGRVVFV